MEIFQRQLAFVQLSIGEDLVDDLLSQPLDSRRCWIRERPGGRFHRIGQHHNPGLFGLRFGSRVAVVFLVNLLYPGILLFLGLLIEVADETGTMVLLNDINDLLAETIFFGQSNAIFNVGYEYEAAHAGCELVVGVFSPLLVLNEIHGFLDFADVVVIGCHLGQYGIGIDRPRGSLHKVPNDDAVGVRLRGLDDEILEDGLLRVRQLQEFDVRRVGKKDFNNGCDSKDNKGGENASQEPKSAAVESLQDDLSCECLS
jgi:hypothetical protein